ncbi:MAG: EAL domain-containing protein [Sulfurimonas sp.]|nr:EAL domain-containing protein [Sulfurimonas sp.]
MQKNIIKFILFPTLFILLFATIYYQRVQLQIDNLIHERYVQTTEQDKRQLDTLIKEKQENILAVSLAVSKYSSVRNVLLGKSKEELKLKEFSSLLKDATSMKDLWFQIISKDGKSIYRSFSEKTGDNLADVRSEIKDILDYPRVISSISVGRFSITYKAIIPVYFDGDFLGVFETLAHFNSVSKKIQQKGLKSILLIDKKFKKQLLHSIHHTFVNDYYIADTKVNPLLLSYIKEYTPEKILKETVNTYILDNEKALLISSYPLYDYLGNSLGYFILFKNLNDVNIKDIEQIQQNIFLLVSIILLIIYILIFYTYKKLKQVEIENKNRELQESIKRKNDILEYISLHDNLTSLPNRDCFKQELKTILSKKTSSATIYVMYIGIDRLKEINDIHGHNIGDKVIQNAAKTLEESLGKDVLIARLTADEFAVVITLDQTLQIDAMAEKVLKDIQVMQTIKGKSIFISVSIGLSIFTKACNSVALLLRNANTAMYKAKTLGGNTYQFYTPEMTTNLLDKIKLADDLNKAIKNDEFEPYFQAQIDTNTNTIMGMEGLIRWIHPELGVIYPDRFIPYAEESGLIIQIDRIMMRKSMQIIMSWGENYSSNLKLSLNLSAVNLESKNFMKELKNTLIETNYNAKNLELEMLESQIMKDQDSSIKILNELKELGIAISIDDFGTGYSSLSILKKLPITKLKIDKSFVDNIPHEKDDVAIVQTIIALANALELKLIAEGVESQEQRDFLVTHKCTLIQGYYYSKPLSPKDFKEFMINFPN